MTPGNTRRRGGSHHRGKVKKVYSSADQVPPHQMNRKKVGESRVSASRGTKRNTKVEEKRGDMEVGVTKKKKRVSCTWLGFQRREWGSKEGRAELQPRGGARKLRREGPKEGPIKKAKTGREKKRERFQTGVTR